MKLFNSVLKYKTILLLMISGFLNTSLSAQKKFTISDGSAFEAKNFYPKFSWNTTPMYYMFGDNKKVLSANEVSFIAKRTGFLCIEKSHAVNQLGAAELGAKHEIAAFNNIKKNIKTLFYFNSAYAWPFSTYNRAFTSDQINKYPELKKFLIIDPKTKELANRDHVFFFDVLNPRFREWWVNTVVKGVEETKSDGAFIDQMHGFTWLRPSKSQEVQKVMGEMMASLKQKLGPDKILLGNNANGNNAQYVFPVVDAMMFEHFDKNHLSKETLLKDWDDMLRIAKAGKMSIFRIGVEVDPYDNNSENYYKGSDRDLKYENLSKERLEFYQACYLIGAQPYSYFQYGWGWQLSSGSMVDYPELQKNLGEPKTAYKRASENSWEFTREFEHASVWVDTEKGKAKIKWH